MTALTGFILGIFVGGLTGIFIMCLCIASGRASRREEAELSQPFAESSADQGGTMR